MPWHNLQSLFGFFAFLLIRFFSKNSESKWSIDYGPCSVKLCLVLPKALKVRPKSFENKKSYCLSVNRQKINYYPVVWGIILQFVLGICVLRTQSGYDFFYWVGENIKAAYQTTKITVSWSLRLELDQFFEPGLASVIISQWLISEKGSNSMLQQRQRSIFWKFHSHFTGCNQAGI